MRIPHRELEIGSLQLRAVPDALDLEALLESLRDAVDHVRDQGPRQAVQRAVLAALRRARDEDLVVLFLDLHAQRNRLRELAERAVDLNTARRDRDHDTG